MSVKRVFIFEQKARNFLKAICSKMKTRVLSTFSGLNYILASVIFDIYLNTQFCPKTSVKGVSLFLSKWPTISNRAKWPDNLPQSWSFQYGHLRFKFSERSIDSHAIHTFNKFHYAVILNTKHA